jgi:hypothetical protein
MMGTASPSLKKDRLTIGPQVANLPHLGALSQLSGVRI